MKIPESVRIGGIEYDVIDNVKDLNDGESLLYGFINFRESTIQISDLCEHQHKCITLLHEILHGIIYGAGLTMDDEEKVVQVLSKGLYQVLQDNARRLFDLIDDQTEGGDS